MQSIPELTVLFQRFGIALALVAPRAAAADTELQIVVRNRRMKAKVARPPFVG